MKNLILLILFFGSVVNAQSLTVGSGDIFPGIYSQRNLIKNPSCLKNALNITATSVSATANTTSSPLDGLSDCKWDPTATAQEISWAMNTMPAGLKGQNCEARIWYRGDASLVSAFVRSSSGDVATGISLTNADQYSRVGSINYPCGDGTAYSVVLKSTGNAASVQYSAYAGLATNLSNISQATFYGGAEQVGASGCTYSENTSSGLTNFVDLGSGTGCNAWTVAGSVSVTGNNTHTVILNNMPPGDYQLIVTGTLYRSAASGQCFYRLSDGTNTYQGQGMTLGAANTFGTNSLLFQVTKTTSANTTYKLQAADDHAGSCELNNTSAGLTTSWKVYRFPSSSEIALTSRLPVLPTVQTFTTGTTYTTPNGVSYIRVRMVGGGGSGGSTGSSGSSAGAAGTSTTFGGFTAGGGSISSTGGAGTGAAIGGGGSGGVNSGSITDAAVGISIGGTQGGAGLTAGGTTVANTSGGSGGGTPFAASSPGSAGGNGRSCVGYGGGGAGGGGSASTFPGGGGGSGSYIEFLIKNPATSYTISVGQGGASKTAGTGGSASGAGCDGYIEVTEYYQNANAPLLVGSVTSNSSGLIRTEHARITISGASTCSIASQSGTWLTSPTASTSICSLTIPSGLFSSTPTCVASSDTSGGDRTCSVGGGGAISSTAVSVQHLTTGTTGNGTCSLICMGPR